MFQPPNEEFYSADFVSVELGDMQLLRQIHRHKEKHLLTFYD